MQIYKDDEYFKTQTQNILSDFDKNTIIKNEQKIKEKLSELYNEQIQKSLDEISKNKPEIKEFMQEIYKINDYNLQEFEPNLITQNNTTIKEKGGYIGKMLNENKGESEIFLQNMYEKYPTLFESNIAKEKITDQVVDKFLEFNKNMHSKIEFNTIKNNIEKSLYDDLSENISFRINMSTDTKGLKPKNEIEKFAKFLNIGKEFKGKQTEALFQTLKMMDKALMDENNRNFKAIYEKIGLEFTDIDGKKIQINSKLGEGNFQKDLNYLIKIGCNDCNIGKSSNVANKLFIKATDTKEPENTKDKKQWLKFKNPATLENFDMVLNGGVKSVVTIAEVIGDEAIANFAENLQKTAGITGAGKSLKSIINQDQNQSKSVLKSMGLAYQKKLASGHIKPPKEKVKEHSNLKNRDIGR